MATTDLAAILTAWPATLEASPLSLVPTAVTFTHDLQPAGMVARSYYLTDDGQISRSSATNDVEVRIDRVTLWVAYPRDFAGAAALTALSDLLDDVYRTLLPIARTAGYNLDPDTRRITPKDDVLIASQAFRVDYDFSSAAA